MSKLNIDANYALVKKNHERYLRENMVTHIEMTGGLKQAHLIKQYREHLGFYRTNKERYLNSAIQQISTASKAGHFALSTLLGIGVGGGSYLKLKSMNVNPLAFLAPDVPGNAAEIAFSGLIGAGITLIAYEAWLKSANKPIADDFEEFQAAMKSAGFTNKKYARLSAELVKLFHFRECILLGLRDNSNINLRNEFITRFPVSGTPTNSKALNSAVEVYFLDELNTLFNNAFREIYNIKNEEIYKEKGQIPILTWIKRFFENEETRWQFTQQLQIHFMDECLTYLEKEMLAPSFMGRHSISSAAIIGLIGGLAALSVSFLVLGGPVGIAIVGISLLVSCCTLAAAYWSINNLDYLKYKRDKNNRIAISHTVENVAKECIRLNRLMVNAVDTSPRDIKCLEKYKTHGHLNGFVKLFTSFNPKEMFRGSRGWLREYASRYRHSKGVEIDLADKLRILIVKGDEQTIKMQKKSFKCLR